MTDTDRHGQRSDDAAFEKAAKRVFDRSVADVDAATGSRLAAARRRALREANAGPHDVRSGGTQAQRPWFTPDRWWLRRTGGLLAVTAALVVAVALWVGSSVQRTEPPAVEDFRSVALLDLEILLGEAEFDLLEDLEFYAWLDELAELAPPVSDDDGIG